MKKKNTPGGATTGLQGVFVSTDEGANFPTAPASITWTVALQSARVARVTSTGAAFPATTTRVDFFRGIPFASDGAAADRVGAEASVETNFLLKVIVDTTAFDGGRGMPAAPVMGTGFAVAGASSSAFTSPSPIMAGAFGATVSTNFSAAYQSPLPTIAATFDVLAVGIQSGFTSPLPVMAATVFEAPQVWTIILPKPSTSITISFT